MDITLNRLKARDPYWGADKVELGDIEKFTDLLSKQPFEGEDEDRKYGFAHCGHTNDAIYGLFVQKYPKVVTDYTETKLEESQKIRDTGEYLFVFYPRKYELYLQAKRSADLPGTTQIIKKFVGLWKLIASSSDGKFLVSTFDYTQDEVDRGRILEIFYTEADSVSELELEDFDRNLVLEEKRLRGDKYQTYFNPIDAYQPAMEEAALRFGNNTEKVSVKAKQGESFKKDPIVRAMLEGSRKPIKIVYKKDSVVRTEYGLTKKKEVITIDSGDYDLENQIGSILEKLQGADTLRTVRRSNNEQIDMFNNESSN